jgi:hemoglobin-like flavoprotein
VPDKIRVFCQALPGFGRDKPQFGVKLNGTEFAIHLTGGLYGEWRQGMTSEQKDLVRASWRMMEPIADLAANLFYSKLFELDPELRHLFKSDMGEQKRKLMSTLGFAVANLNSMDALIPVVQQMGKRHLGYGVEEKHYETAGAALLWTLQQGLGPSFSPQVKESWLAVYGLLTGVMKAAAKEASMAAAA